ncbi:hypothetical protein V5F49_01365 [Xanthobacter sp. V3C-3]
MRAAMSWIGIVEAVSPATAARARSASISRDRLVLSWARRRCRVRVLM